MEILEIAGVELVGVSACVPARAVDVVESLAPLLGDKAAGVVEATGIRTRRVAGADTSAFDLCAAAAERLFAAAPDRAAYARSFGAVIFVSFTERTRMPSAAARAQARLGLPRDVLALDLSLACSGWVSGLHLAALLARETGRRVLLLDGDMQSARIGEGDASTLPLLSDGGTAAVVAPSPSAVPWRFAFMSDGAKGDALRLDDGGRISMDGFAVFKFVAGEVTAFLRDFLAAAPGGSRSPSASRRSGSGPRASGSATSPRRRCRPRSPPVPPPRSAPAARSTSSRRPSAAGFPRPRRAFRSVQARAWRSSTMNAEREFLDFAAGLFGVDPSALSLATAYGSLPQWDSVMHLRLVMEFEAKYGVSIALEEVPAMTTLGDFFAKAGKGGA